MDYLSFILALVDVLLSLANSRLDPCRIHLPDGLSNGLANALLDSALLDSEDDCLHLRVRLDVSECGDAAHGTFDAKR